MDGFPHPYRLVIVAILAALALIATTGFAGAAEPIGNARKVVNKVYGATLNRTIRDGETLVENQPVSTGAASATDLKFLDDSTLFIGEHANVDLDRLIYDPRAKKVSGAIELTKGLLRFASAAATKVDIAVNTRHGAFGVRGTVFDLLATSAASEIAVHEGEVAVATRFGTTPVRAGEVFRVSAAQPPEAMPGPSLEMRAGVRQMLALLDAPDFTPEARKQKQDTAAAFTALEQTAPFKDAIRATKRENLLYLDTTAGRIVIEMLPDLAPWHVARIRELVRARFYDGQVFHSVVPGFAVETGDPTGTGNGGSGKPLKAEIGKTSFVRGTVGMKRMNAGVDSGDSQFFITLAPARHLDGKYTAWGRVIFGIEIADKLKPGRPPRDPDRIIALRMVADPDAGTIRVPCRDLDRRLGLCR